MAKAQDEKETKPQKEAKAKKAKVEDPNKLPFNFVEFITSPSFMVAIIFVVMMVVGGVIVYM